MNVFPPILTNRLPPQQSTSPKHLPQQRRVHFETIKPSVAPETTEKDSSDVNLLNRGRDQNSAMDSLSADIGHANDQNPSSSNQGPATEANPNRTQVQSQIVGTTSAEQAADSSSIFYFKYSNEDVEGMEEDEDGEGASTCDDSEESDYVKNDWSDSENGSGNGLRSREAQEAELQNKYREAVAQLEKGNWEKAALTFTTVLLNPIMAKFHVADWEAFDWGGANSAEPKMLSNMIKIFFNSTLTMAALVENPIPFYMQALSIRPDSKDLWFMCGQRAVKQRDWRSARFCFNQCATEFRAVEALLLVHYLDGDFLGCTSTLKRLFELHPEHELGHAIRSSIVESSPIWKQLHEETFSKQILNYSLGERSKEMVNQRIQHFQRNGPESDANKPSATFNPFQQVFKETQPRFAPLKVKLNLGMNMEQLGKILCDIFDRIEQSSSFVEQQVVFELKNDVIADDIASVAAVNVFDGLETMDLDNAVNDQDLMQRLLEQIPNPESILISDAIISQHVVLDSEQPLQPNDELADQGRTQEITSQEEDLFAQQQQQTTAETVSQDEETDMNTNGPSSLLPIDNQKELHSEAKKRRQKKRKLFERANQENIGPPGIELTAEEMPRRSLRLVDEPQMMTADNNAPTAADGRWTVLRMMNLEAISSNEPATGPRKSTQFEADTFEAKDLPSIDSLIANIVNKSSSAAERGIFQQFLFEFLEWIAAEQASGVALTFEQAEVFRNVYIRWSDSPGMISTNFMPSNLSVHQLAAELGSHRALSILQFHYNNNRFRQLLKANEEEEPMKISEHLLAQREDQETMVEMDDQEEIINEPTPPKQFDANSEEALLKWVVGRIDAEQKNKPKQIEHLEFAEERMAESQPEPAQNPIQSNGEVATDSTTSSLQNTAGDPELRRLEIRYRWLVANLQPDELGLPSSHAIHFAHTHSQLDRILRLLEPEWRIWSNANFGINCLSHRNVKETLQSRVRQFQARQIDQLTESKRFEELKDVLLHSYDWEVWAEDGHSTKMFLLIQCLQETGEPVAAILPWINRILSLLTNLEVKTLQAKRILRRCLSLLNDALPFEADLDLLLGQQSQQLLTQLGTQLGRLANPEQFPYLVRSIDLWRWCYRIAKCLEGELSVTKLLAFYDYCDSEEGPPKRQPTRALMVLGRAHEVLGKARKCSKREGQFLRFVLNEFTWVLNQPVVHRLVGGKKFEDIRENAASEIIRCLHCALSENFPTQPKARNRYSDHHSKLQWTADWEMALQLIPLLGPTELYEITSDQRPHFDFVDTLTKAFGHLLLVGQSQLDLLDKFCQNPPRIELIEMLDSDGLWCAYEEQLEMDREGKRRFRELNESEDAAEQQFAPEDGRREEMKAMRARLLYQLAHFHSRYGHESENEFLRKCLAVGGQHLPSNILSSLWHALGSAPTHTYAYTTLGDAELLEKVDAYLFPFKMALLLNWEFAEAHLDIGTLMYQLRTRLMRFIKQKTLSLEMTRKVHLKVEGMLQKARLHFHLAQRFNVDSTKDLGWLSNYFQAKISEKLDEQAETVLRFYYNAALELEYDGLQYLPKINRTKQTFFEPLEIHYKVHSFALRRLHKLLLHKPDASSREFSVIHAFLRLFRHHGVQQRSTDAKRSAAAFYGKEEAQDEVDGQAKKWMAVERKITKLTEEGEEEGDQLLAMEVGHVVDKLATSTEHSVEIERLCLQAFDAILQRFPHYKAMFRLAQKFYQQDKNYKKAANLLFEKLFLMGRKQRSNNFLENVVEIKRTDFERNGSFPYHLFKITKLAGQASFLSRDVVRLRHLIVALTAYKPATSSREILSNAEVLELMTMCTQWFNELIRELAQRDANDYEKLGKVIEHMEEVIQRLKRDKRCPYAELESKLYQCIHRRDRLAPGADDDIIVLEQSSSTATASRQPQLSRFSNLPGAAQQPTAAAKKPPQQQQKKKVVKLPIPAGSTTSGNQGQVPQPKLAIPIGVAKPTTTSAAAAATAEGEGNATTANTTAAVYNNLLASLMELIKRSPQNIALLELIRKEPNNPRLLEILKALLQKQSSSTLKRPFPAGDQQQQPNQQQQQQQTGQQSTSTSSTAIAQQQQQQQQQTPATTATTTTMASNHAMLQPPAQKKLKRIDDQAVQLLQKALETHPQILEMDSTKLRIFFERLGYEYSYEELTRRVLPKIQQQKLAAKAAQKPQQQQQQLQQQQPQQKQPGTHIQQQQQLREGSSSKSNAVPAAHPMPVASTSTAAARIQHSLISHRQQSTVSHRPLTSASKVTAPVANAGMTTGGGNGGGDHHRRMLGLPPTVRGTKPKQQQQPMPSMAAPMAARQSTSAQQQLQSKPPAAVAVVRPSPNSQQTQRQAQQPQPQQQQQQLLQPQGNSNNPISLAQFERALLMVGQQQQQRTNIGAQLLPSANANTSQQQQQQSAAAAATSFQEEAFRRYMLDLMPFSTLANAQQTTAAAQTTTSQQEQQMWQRQQQPVVAATAADLWPQLQQGQQPSSTSSIPTAQLSASALLQSAAAQQSNANSAALLSSYLVGGLQSTTATAPSSSHVPQHQQHIQQPQPQLRQQQPQMPNIRYLHNSISSMQAQQQQQQQMQQPPRIQHPAPQFQQLQQQQPTTTQSPQQLFEQLMSFQQLEQIRRIRERLGQQQQQQQQLDGNANSSSGKQQQQQPRFG